MPQSKDQKIDKKTEKEIEKKIERVKAHLPLPEDPPVEPDWNTADARSVAVGSGRFASDISYGDAASAGLREPASARREEIDYSGIGRQGHDRLPTPPRDAFAKKHVKPCFCKACTTERVVTHEE